MRGGKTIADEIVPEALETERTVAEAAYYETSHNDAEVQRALVQRPS
jgi:hypothetical protein